MDVETTCCGQRHDDGGMCRSKGYLSRRKEDCDLFHLAACTFMPSVVQSVCACGHRAFPADCRFSVGVCYRQGYRYKKAYIATQGALAETTEDFWRMLWEHNSTIVVMLTKLREMGRVSVLSYLHVSIPVAHWC